MLPSLCPLVPVSYGEDTQNPTPTELALGSTFAAGNLAHDIASQSTKCPLNSLTLDFQEATIHIPHALSEKSFARMEIISQNETTTREFETVNLYGREVADFIALLGGQSSVGTTIQEACLSVHILQAIPS